MVNASVRNDSLKMAVYHIPCCQFLLKSYLGLFRLPKQNILNIIVKALPSVNFLTYSLRNEAGLGSRQSSLWRLLSESRP